MRPIALIVAGMLGLLFAAGCSEADAGDRVQVRTLTGANLRFAPATVTVKAGTPVQLALTNPDRVDHDIVLEGMPASNIEDDRRAGDGGDGDESSHDHTAVESGAIVAHAKPGATARAWFTPVERGRYPFYCSIPGHRKSGMIGTLVVE